jgi:hypothetical protein
VAIKGEVKYTLEFLIGKYKVKISLGEIRIILKLNQ